MFSSWLVACIILFSSLAHSQSSPRWRVGQDFTKRAAARESTRWTLSDWLAIKDRNSMMDMWLTMNTPSPFELMLGGSYNSFKTEDLAAGPASTHTTLSGDFSAYAGFVGLSAEYERNSDEGFTDSAGLFNLRLFGDSLQNTSLTLHYGLRSREMTQQRLSQQFGQASLQIYLMKYFGIDGKYRYFLPSSTDNWDQVEGSLTEGGVFIDFKALRVFGSWYKESQKYKIPAATDDTVIDRSGIRSGIKIFF